MKNLLCLLLACSVIMNMADAQIKKAPAPMFRDPITDGAADPVMVYNRAEKSWWLLYTQRRANTDAADVAYCYGTAIGIASSDDEGASWVYRGTLKLEFEQGTNTFWAPDVVYENGVYHMFVTYIRGVRNHWGGRPKMAHYTSKNLWDWKFEGFPQLTSERVIDATLFKGKDNLWRMWYKDSENPEGNMLMAASKDLFKWQINNKPVIPGKAQEGPKVFEYHDFYWLITDEWKGMRVYRSKDLVSWEKQGLILSDHGKRPDDSPTGAHGDIIVLNDNVFVFYFTHPGRENHNKADNNSIGVLPYALRRSSIQVAELKFENGSFTSNRDEPFDFRMVAPQLK